MVLEHLISSREMMRYEIAGAYLTYLYTMPLYGETLLL